MYTGARDSNTTDGEDHMRNQTALMAAFALLTTSSALAAEPPKPAEPAKPAAEKPAAEKPGAPMQAPKPAPENDVIKKSVGNWSCEGTAKGPESKYKSTWSVKSILGGHWYGITYKRAKAGPMPAFEGNATIGYSVADKKYWFVGVDNMGGWINLTSTDGATYTGDGTPGGKKAPVKFTFTGGKDKKGQDSDKLFDVTLDFGVASSHESCKK
jgi:hypothetical protein